MKVKEFGKILVCRILWPVYDRLYYVYFIILCKVLGPFLRRKAKKEHDKGAYDFLEEPAPPGDDEIF